MDKLKYRLDYLTAVNEKLCDSDRMYRMIADSTRGLYIYRNDKRNLLEFIGPWEEYLGYKPKAGEFSENELKELILPEDLISFIDDILCMDEKRLEHSVIYIRDRKKRRFKCVGTVYYDEKGVPTDRLIGFTEAEPGEIR